MSDYEIGKDIQSLVQRVESLESQLGSARSEGPSETVASVALSSAAKKTAAEMAAYVIYDATNGAIGHDPPSRGRADGTAWFDYGNTTSGSLMYGPYVTLEPGAYEYWFDVKFRIPPCGNADGRGLFVLDAARNVGQVIPDSRRVAPWNWFCSSPNTHEGVYDAWMGGTFAIAETTNQVEMRLRNLVAGSATFPMEILVRRLLYRKIS